MQLIQETSGTNNEKESTPNSTYNLGNHDNACRRMICFSQIYNSKKKLSVFKSNLLLSWQVFLCICDGLWHRLLACCRLVYLCFILFQNSSLTHFLQNVSMVYFIDLFHGILCLFDIQNLNKGIVCTGHKLTSTSEPVSWFSRCDPRFQSCS